MRVRELIEKLRKMDQDAHVVVNGRVVHDVEERAGRVSDEPLQTDYFRETSKGRQRGAVMLRYAEGSDGKQRLSSVFPL